MTRLRVLAIVFAVFLVSLIVLADLGLMRFWMRLINRIPFADKGVHFFLVGTLTFLATASLIEYFSSRDPGRVALASVLFFAFVFTLEEISQGPISGRNASVKDLLANYAGVLVFGFLAWWRGRKTTNLIETPGS
jgi:VanZ family protein